MKIILNPTLQHFSKIHWVFSVLNSYCGGQIELITSPDIEATEFQFNHGKLSSNIAFWDKVDKREFDQIEVNNELFCTNPEGGPDLLATAFYFLNCLWERKTNAVKDQLGRHEYQYSIWRQNGFNAPVTIVNQCFDLLLLRLGCELPQNKSRIHLSHDIDSVFGSLTQDGFWIAKRLKFVELIKVLWRNIINGPQWFNFRKIVEVERKRGYTSTFFWLTSRERYQGKLRNADYSIESEKIKKEIDWISQQGFENGLHKCLSKSSFEIEIQRLPFSCQFNRNHFLKFEFEDLITEIDEVGLKCDFSLGYAEVMGFRNGYSLPFVPYILEKKRPANFVEVPLAVMDGTLSIYQKLAPENAIEKIKSFIDLHEKNSLICFLWHNSHFTNYKYEGYYHVYKQTLNYCKSKNLESVKSNTVYDEFKF